MPDLQLLETRNVEVPVSEAEMPDLWFLKYDDKRDHIRTESNPANGDQGLVG
jgi:hypothetical protein